ncbi:hypothetical protein COMA1_50175 [Candidatus Nitrospira nitrosa]|uniref:Uncharacterized protein n=1 Tax=Candidatus Nitrospira nitrosa TaxID=1742972 RepID=A0A0S4LM15_9BACT|nr:hypothetical protein [Candidatus Nitrospira nitrosa]CUS38572.1 hypothetical protein COMA1_50175 [Candidatus Nitrospira nitrosa]
MDPKGSEPTNSGGSPESTQAGVLSSNERALFDDLFRALDSLVLERSTDGQAFRPIHTMPEWAHCLITKDSDQPGRDLWIPRSAFLEFYMQEANQWWDQHEGGALPPAPWEEPGPSDAPLDLEVTVTAIGHRKLLVIKRGAPSRRAYIQLMREMKLNLNQSPPLF